MQTKTVYLETGDETLSLKKYVLQVVDGPNAGQRGVFSARHVQIGASPDTDFILEDSAVSRFHAEIRVDGVGYHLDDLDSKNGVWVGSLRVGSVVLEPGLEFKVGTSTIRFDITEEQVDIRFSGKTRFGNIIGKSREMRRIFALLERVAPTDATVLIEGESGTGKELVAEAIHNHSPRKNKPFVVFDCSAVARELIESELFGHVKGAFTGATANRKGAFEQADGGTLFLDELGELELDLQPKLLRALEKREVKPVGGVQNVKVDVRIVAATNRNLIHEVRQGNFREDLYYRFEIIKIVLPPLRQRTGDVPMLVDHFLKVVSERTGLQGLNIAYSTMEKLKQHRWPGNVRELKNFVERAALLADNDRIETRYLNFQANRGQAAAGEAAPEEGGEHAGLRFGKVALDEDIPFKEAKNQLIEEFEMAYWTRLLERTDGNVSKAARIAGVHRKSLEYILKKLDISRKDLKS